MKKLFSSAFILLTLCFSSCSSIQPTQSVQNNLSSAFSSDMTIALDKFTAEGVIRRNGEADWEAEFSSPNTLAGVSMKFCQGSVTASYKGLDFSVPKSALPVKSMLVNLIEAVDTNARTEQLDCTGKDGLFDVSGSLDGGDYVLTLDSGGNLKSFSMPNNLLKMDFQIQNSELRIENQSEAETQPSSSES